MKLLSTATILENKSKFIGYYYEINTKEEIKTIIDKLRVEHKKAKHIVYAYKFANTAGKSDDKEPSGTAGMQLYNLLELNKLENKLLVVVRYFGGTKLGAGLLSRTYKNTGINTIKNTSLN